MSSDAKMSSRSIGNALYGLQDTSSEALGINNLIDALNIKITNYVGKFILSTDSIHLYYPLIAFTFI